MIFKQKVGLISFQVDMICMSGSLIDVTLQCPYNDGKVHKVQTMRHSNARAGNYGKEET